MRFPEALYERAIEDGRWIVVYAMTFGKARLCVGDEVCIDNGYCYADPRRAVEAAKVWTGDGDPLDGWHRNPFDGRRRPNGDPALEYVERGY
jgi:hypothetical protein